LEKEDEDKKIQQQRTKDRLEWLALKRTQEAVKSKQKSNRQDNNNNQKDKLEKLEEKFKDYVPSVNLQYRDESGRDLTPKEVPRCNIVLQGAITAFPWKGNCKIKEGKKADQTAKRNDY
jgi:hypothetical protein